MIGLSHLRFALSSSIHPSPPKTKLCRVVASWYPETNLKELPWVIVAWPSEPLLRLVKGAIPPAFGVDITPVFWLAIFTFFNEILLGQQGLLVMKMKYGI
jgi:YggT family protein